MNYSPQIVDLKPYVEKNTISVRKMTGNTFILVAIILLVVSSIPYITYALEQARGSETSTSKELPGTSKTLLGASAPRVAGITDTVQPKSAESQALPETQLPTGEKNKKMELASGIPSENAPTPEKGETLGHLYVNGAKVNVNAPVIEGVDASSFDFGVGHQPGTSLPNEVSGNVVIAGHRWLPKGNAYSKIFLDLPEINVGETIDFVYNDRTYTYEVTSTEILKPTDVHILNHTDQPELTLYTCHPWNSTKSRFVVHSTLVEVR